jgi:DNA-binding LytR/AlgR family response regulator
MTCIVVDDEPLAREAILTLIRQMPELELIKEFSSADAASKYLETESVDVIFWTSRCRERTGSVSRKRSRKIR